MNFFKYLYCNYYKFQEKIGNADIAPFSSLLIISFTIMLYYFSLFFIIITIFPKDLLNIDMTYFKYLTFILFFALIILFYFIFLKSGKYKKILKEHNKTTNRSLLAFLFPLVAFILFNLGWILKMLQNQGKL
jgi:hypothetical protein